jgi:hypothetical protein
VKTSLKFLTLSTLFVIASTFSIASSNAATVKPNAYYNDCGTPTFSPKSITQYCADAGAGVVNIKWSLWGNTSAKGVGTYYINDCTPDCASGKTLKTSVNVLLNGLTTTHGKKYLMHVTVTPLAGKKFVWPTSMKPVPTSVNWVTNYWQG